MEGLLSKDLHLQVISVIAKRLGSTRNITHFKR